MDDRTREAFATPWDQCTPEQRALREAWLPRREDPQPAYEAELIRRLQAGLPLSREDRRRAKRYLKR